MLFQYSLCYFSIQCAISVFNVLFQYSLCYFSFNLSISVLCVISVLVVLFQCCATSVFIVYIFTIYGAVPLFIVLFINHGIYYKSKEFTFIANHFTGQFLRAASITEDLATHPAVMSAPESGEPISTVITFSTATIWHPILLKVTVPVNLWSLKTINRSFDG